MIVANAPEWRSLLDRWQLAAKHKLFRSIGMEAAQ
jgi:hypothetical protein